MKLLVKLMLFFFISFLSAPTIIMLIETNNDVSLFYSFSEEENQKDFKEIIADFNQEYVTVFNFFPQINRSKIISENLSRHDNVFEEIFSPPPELV